MTEYEAEEIEFEWITEGDRVRLTADDITHEFNVGEVIGPYIYDRTGRPYTKVNWKVERLTEPFKLPTGEWAMVAHPSGREYIAYVYKDQKWYELDDTALRIPKVGGEVSNEEVKNAIKELGFQVVFEGVAE